MNHANPVILLEKEHWQSEQPEHFSLSSSTELLLELI